MNRQKAKQFSSILLPIRIASAFLSFVIFFISIFPAGTVIAVPVVDICAKSSFFKITNRDEVSSVFPVASVRENYDAYGIMIGGSPNILNPSATNMLYSGEQFDPTLQMQYLRARYYDQNTGRFNRLDPFGGNNYDPQSLHKYAYCHCNPVMGIDPSGEFTIVNTMIVVAIIAIASVGMYFTYSRERRGRIIGLFAANKGRNKILMQKANLCTPPSPYNLSELSFILDYYAFVYPKVTNRACDLATINLSKYMHLIYKNSFLFVEAELFLVENPTVGDNDQVDNVIILIPKKFIVNGKCPDVSDMSWYNSEEKKKIICFYPGASPIQPIINLYAFIETKKSTKNQKVMNIFWDRRY